MKMLKNRKSNEQVISKQHNKSSNKQKGASSTTQLLSEKRSTYKNFTRSVIILSVLVIVYFSNRTKETKFALKSENIQLRSQKFQCSIQYLDEINQFPKCVPTNCGRFVTDTLIDRLEVDKMLEIAKKGMSYGGSSGGATILDLHSGALSYGENFIDIYKLSKIENAFAPEHVTAYKLVKSKIRKAIADNFLIDEKELHLTHPTFFSRINNDEAKTIHDEYWHEHVDKETYASFHYTSLLYLNNYSSDFQGGRFVFRDKSDGQNHTSIIEPKRGRVSAFTSGSENTHFVEKVTSGTRFAITISFTCDPKYAIDDPNFKSSQAEEY